MFPLFRKNLLFLPSCCFSSSSQVLTFLTRFPVLGFSSPPPPTPPQPPSRRVKVLVWWDVDNCRVPSGVSYWNVAPSIMAAVRANGIKGNIQIRAYYPFSESKVSVVDKDALCATGVDLHPVSGGNNDAYKCLLTELNDWVARHPPPAHLFLILDDRCDRYFSGIVHRLRMNNYNVLIACPGRGSDILRSAATIMWRWSSMLKGEDLIGKHFNYPPDGPFDSWYGDSKVPLEPFSATSEPTSSEIAMFLKPSSYMKSGEVPESVSRLVKKISSSYPNGISIGNLRAELTKCDVPLGKPFYGHKKFSNFLVSIPHVQLLYLGEGKFSVHLIASTTSAVKNNKQRDETSTQKLHNEESPSHKHFL